MKNLLKLLAILALLSISIYLIAQEGTAPESEPFMSFEEGVEGWQLADYWAGSAGVDVSSEFTSDGEQTMAMTIVTTGEAWQEGGVFFQTGGLDWTTYESLQVDIYSPAEATDFITQIFVKTGEQWTWANTPDTPLVAGEWTTVTANLADLGDMTAVNEVGIKIGSSATAFDGQFFADNMRLIPGISGGDDTEDMGMSTAEPFMSFEEGVEGWQLADYWAGSAGVDVSSDFVTDGEQAMAMTIVTTGEAWQEGGVFFQTGGLDWTTYESLQVDIYSPAEATDFITQIFVKTGEQWTWANTPDTPLVAGEWTTVSANLADLGDMTAVNEVGIKIGSSATAFDGQFYADNMRLIPGMSGGDDTEDMGMSTAEPFMSFEEGVEGWQLADYWAGSAGVDVSSDFVTDGEQAMAMTIVTTGEAWQEGGVFFQTGGLDWTTYESLQVDIYSPAEATDFITQIFVKTGDQWTWANTPDTPLVAGEWTTVSANLADLGDMTAVNEVGIKIGSSATAFDGQFFADNMRFIVGGSVSDAETTADTETASIADDGNLASGKIAVASTEENAGHIAAYAVDGKPATRWSTEYVDGQTLDVDLGAVYSVTDVVLHWEAAFGAVYDIQAWDGSDWLSVFSETEGDGAFDEITLDEPVNTRYIRMNGIARATQWGFSLWEMSVYGNPADADETLETMPASFENLSVTVETISEEEILYDFEDGENVFTLADYWAGGTSLEVVDGTLQMGIITSGSEWQEGGFFIQPEGGLDWSDYDLLAMDIYVPEGASEFTAQIFLKTGEDLVWANTSGTTPIEGEWVTVEATLADMGDSSAVNEFGMKLGSSNTAFEGIVQIDNIRLINRTEVVTTEVLSITSETFNSFEDGVEGWQLADYWAGSAGVDVSSEFVSDGEQSMAVTIVTSGDAWQEGGVFFQTGGFDWSGYDSLEVDIYAPEEASEFITQIFTKTGADWVWANTSDTALNPGEWTTVSATLADLGDMTAVNEVGIKIGSSTTAFDGQFYVDNMRFISSGVAEEAIASEVYDIVSVTPLTEEATLYNLFELEVELDAVYNNPYDPIDIRLDAQFRSPDGETMLVPGFYMAEFLTSDTGNAIATGDESWRIRFAPMQTGDWEYRVVANTLTSRTNSAWQSFTVLDSDNPGFVRIDERNSRYFAFDDGTPYFPIGENMAWSVGSPLADYDMWLSELSGNGGNFIRVWMASWGFGIEWKDTGLGDYSNRQRQAYQLDQVLELADENDVYIMLSLLNHGAFNETVDAEWDSNPFNVENGGMLEDPAEFASNPEAIRYWNQRLRYIAARYGYSTNIMTWEWWNEVNWTAMVNSEILAPWIERSAIYLDNLDPYDHLMSHSGSPIGDERVWNLESMDYTQEHLYNMSNLQQTFNNTIPEWLERYPDRPFLLGEFGSPNEFDEDGLLLHLGLWSAPMNGAAGTGMFWWWDTYIHPNELYYHFNGVSAFFADEDLASSSWEATTATTSDRAARVFGLQSETSALLWVVNRDYSESTFLSEVQDNLRNDVADPTIVDFDDVEGVSVSVNLPDGDYTVELWNTITGEVSSTETLSSTDSTLEIALPTFDTDIAIKINPTE